MPSDAGAVPLPASDPRTAGWPSAGAASERLHLLTFFRFVAALWILLLHLQSRFDVGWPAPLATLVSNGAYAMSFFFVLSGTVLAFGYASLSNAGPDTTRFYVARCARIYPAYAVVHLASLPWIGIPLPAEWMRWLYVNTTSALGIQAWFPHAFVGANTGTWSISCEFFFYAIFPALLPLAHRFAFPVNFPRALLYLSLFIGFLGLVDFVFAGQDTFPVYYISPLLRLPEFVLGMVLGLALRRRPRVPAVPFWFVLLSAVAIVLVSLNTAYRVGLWTRANIVVVPAIAALIYWSAAYELTHPGLTRARFWSVLRYLGEISYCLFLAQLPLLMWLSDVIARGGPLLQRLKSAPVASWSLCIAATLVASIALHELVEKPARRFLLSRFDRKRVARPAAVAA